MEKASNNTKKPTVFKVATLLIAIAIFGQLLGFLKTKLVNANFPLIGPNSTDAYFAAFTIPDLFFYTISAGALSVAFMPVLSDHLHKYGRKAVWDLTASLANLLIIVMIIVGFIILIFAKPLVHYVVAPGLDPAQLRNATDIMRLLAFNPLLFTVSGLLTSVQQTLGRFFFYAIAPLFYNVSIIASIFIFRHNLGLPGLGIGALFGAILQLAVVLVGLKKLNFSWHRKIKWRNTGFRTIMHNLPPRSFGSGLNQMEDIVETHIASGLGSGNISNYNNAYILSQAPILLLGSAISTAAFPRLNARLSQNRPDLFRKDFLKIVRVMLWLTAPIVILSYYCRGYLARLIFSRGNNEIAIIFGFLAFAIFFQILYQIMSRWFYAQKDTKTSLYVSVITIFLNIVLAITLAKPSVFGVAGLAIAESSVSFIQVLILGIIMVYRDRKLIDFTFIAGVIKIILVTGFTFVAGFVMITLMPFDILEKGFISLGSRLFIISGVTLLVHVIASTVFELDESKPILAFVKKVALKPIKIDLS